VGEIILLFTVDEHLRGDDPFPLPDPREAAIDPFKLPEHDYSLWRLRDRLRQVDLGEEGIGNWDWRKIKGALRDLGYTPSAEADALTSLAEHFFPAAIEAHGHQVSREDRQFRVDLPSTATTVTMWSTEQRGPFLYDSSGPGQLWVELPLCEDAVIDKLINTRQLNNKEISAVQDLYFAPRSALAPFAAIFANFDDAVDKLVHEPSEEERFYFFQQQFALFHRRCEIIADHLAEHVSAAAGGDKEERRNAAWLILRSVFAE
jgi:hypothetical protein